jgi:hypothetical protein
MKFWTQQRFAHRVKLTPGRISQLVREGTIQLINGKWIDPIQAEEAIKQKRERSKQLDLEIPRCKQAARKESLEDLRKKIEKLELRVLALEKSNPCLSTGSKLLP